MDVRHMGIRMLTRHFQYFLILDQGIDEPYGCIEIPVLGGIKVRMPLGYGRSGVVHHSRETVTP